MPDDHERQAQHQESVWRQRANFIIAAPIDAGATNITSEQLWGRKISDTEFEICCIPFFVYDLALGDIVRTSPSGGKKYMIDEVIRASGHFTFRVSLGQSPMTLEQLIGALEPLDVLVERSSATLLAIDATDADHAQRVADYLAAEERVSRLIYETGRTV